VLPVSHFVGSYPWLVLWCSHFLHHFWGIMCAAVGAATSMGDFWPQSNRPLNPPALCQWFVVIAQFWMLLQDEQMVWGGVG